MSDNKEYFESTLTRLNENEVLIQIKGELDTASTVIKLSVDQFRALYRMIFNSIKKEAEQPQLS